MFFLVVDDDALSRDVLTLLLEAEGYEVEVAASGEAAMSLLAAAASEARTFPDVILTDIQMPGLAGAALAQALQPFLQSHTLLLAMSGSQPASSALTGFDGFLLKPFTVSDLRSMIAAKGRPQPPQTNLAPSRPVTSPLDEDIYVKMSDLMPAAQLGQLYALCLGDARKRIAHMQSLAAAGDDAQYRKEAHAVKGGCGMIGASELYQLASVAEEAGLTLPGTSPGTSNVTATLAQLSRACDRLERILQERTQK